MMDERSIPFKAKPPSVTTERRAAVREGRGGRLADAEHREGRRGKSRGKSLAEGGGLRDKVGTIFSYILL